jgi:site-specific DNA recombinase
MEAQEQIRYCLYARKSTEQDERQALSIDSQTKEMEQIAEREGLNVVKVLRESHSAKTSGTRPVYMQLIREIREGEYQGVLTWAPDRLSRNAGDLGSLVDLMDLGLLHNIKTYNQSFSNSPNEKFLLMILCSQAKLENDNKSINVKRGIRTKCEMGWRPGVAPLGYFNRAFGGINDIVVDPDRAPYIKEIFQRCAAGESGRAIKRWIDKTNFTNRSGAKPTLSQIYLMFKCTFYHGEFEFGGKVYKGAHEPIISKELFDQVQKALVVAPKSKWGGKHFAFRHLLRCANCGAGICGEEKFKKLKNGETNRYVYYHCSRQVNRDCKEPFVTEEELARKLVEFIQNTDPKHINISEALRNKITSFQRIRNKILEKYKIATEKDLDLPSYLEYISQEGKREKITEVVGAIEHELFIHNREIVKGRISLKSDIISVK